MDQNQERSGRLASYAEQTEGGDTKDFTHAFQEKYIDSAEEFLAFKEWHEAFTETCEECRREGEFP